MEPTRSLVPAAAVLLLVSAPAQTRISHGYSGILTIDTVSAVNDHASALPQATTLAR